MNLLIFTDLDGTLLDEGSYSFEAAKAGLERIRCQQIPLIFTTSKTRLEIEALHAEMQIREPFIAENGAAIFFPEGYRNFKIDASYRQPPYTVIQLGESYIEIRRFVGSLKERFNLKGFGDLSVEQIELLTGLSPEEASRAKRREFEEPFLIDDESKIDEIARIAASHGLKITSGERFFHLIRDSARQGPRCGAVYGDIC